jgi:hypothetical protein
LRHHIDNESRVLPITQFRNEIFQYHTEKTPVEYPYALNGSVLAPANQEKDLGVLVSNELCWKKQVVEQTSKANKLQEFVRRSSREIRSQRTRRCLLLSVVRPHLGYATQICAPQTVELIKRVERVQRRATKFTLNLPFHCELTYEDRLQATDLLPICYRHEYLDLTIFFKMFNGLVCVSKEIIAERKHGNIRTTRATSNSDIITFRIRKF